MDEVELPLRAPWKKYYNGKEKWKFTSKSVSDLNNLLKGGPGFGKSTLLPGLY